MAVKFILESLCRASAVREKGFSSLLDVSEILLSS